MRLFAAVIALVMACAVSGQVMKHDAALEQEIRHREQAQVDALLKNDIAAMRRNWAPDYVVNNPTNQVVDASKGRIQAGTRTYSSFVRDIERVLIRGNTVIVMGQETVVPSGDAPDSGQTIVRRFTNIWMMHEGKWLLTARQATVICK